MAGQALNGGGLEQVGGIDQHRAEAVTVVIGFQCQVQLRGAVVQAQRLGLQAGQLPGGQAAVDALVVVHDLEQRVDAQAALGLQGFDQLLERQVLVRLGAQGHVAHLVEQCGKTQAVTNLGTHYLSVDEQADQAFGLQAVAVGVGHADADIGLAAVAVQQGLERGQQDHEWRSVLGLCQLTHGLAEGAGDLQFEARAAVALARRARVVGRQFEHRLLVAQPFGPPGQLALALARLHPFPLPARVVAVLDGLCRKRRLGALAGIAGQQLLDQHAHRPTVGNQVVQGQQQQVIVIGQTHQAHPPQRPCGQLERRGELGGHAGRDLGLTLGQRQRAVVDHQASQPVVVEALAHLALVFLQARAQAGLALANPGQAAPQGCQVERTAQAQGRRHVIGAALGFELPEEPLALLGIGQRSVAAIAGGHDRQACDIDTHLLQAGKQQPALAAVQPPDTGDQFLGACGPLLMHCVPPVHRARRRSGRARHPARHRTWWLVDGWPGLRSVEGPGNP